MSVIYQFASTLASATFVADLDHSKVMDWRQGYFDGSEPRRLEVHRESLADRWIPFEGQLDFRTTESIPKQALDFVMFSPVSTMVAVRDAVLEQTEVLWGLVEALPLRCRDYDYSAIHAPRHADILNLDASTYRVPRSPERVLSSGCLTLPIVAVFDPSTLDEVDLFRVPQMTAMFCTQGFIDRLDELGITGYGARQVWPPTEEQLAEEARLLALQRAGKMHGQMHFRPEALEA